jgi:predicted Zn-dependent protease with MMP-like domain
VPRSFAEASGPFSALALCAAYGDRHREAQVGILLRFRPRSNLPCMSEILGPLRAAAITAFIAGLGLLLLDPPSLDGLRDLLVVLVGAVAFLLVMAWATVALIGDDEMPEPEFRRLVDRSEALAMLPPPDQPPSEFDTLVMEALDDLPEQFRELLKHTPVVVSSRGHEHHAYGHYIGGTIARDIYPDRIVIYQDTLERDFGHDPELLQAQVERVVRHELGHHLGWDERGVRSLGL